MKLPTESPCNHSNTTETSASVRVPAVSNSTDREVDYSEYVWMGEEMEEFDRECIEQLLEDDFIETCFEEMLEEEDEVYEFIEAVVDKNPDMDPELVLEHLKAVALGNNVEITFLEDPTKALRKLNPNAPEFVPSQASDSRELDALHHDR